jgi:hypothetical protein
MKPSPSVYSIMLASTGYKQARQQSAHMLRQARQCFRLGRRQWAMRDAVSSGRWKASAESWMRSMIECFSV